jgi:hypothetical protein
MRPIERGPAPGLFDNYEEAKPRLVERLGPYCSSCERSLPTMLAVEHIQPKGLAQYAHLINDWTNFLLACPNCNSAKQDTPVEPADFYLPDRDNTFLAFAYADDGSVGADARLTADQQAIASRTIELVALNKHDHRNWTDPALPHAALERLGQRLAAWNTARESLADLQARPCDEVRRCIVRTALATGFFSIWMHVFAAYPDLCERFITGFPHTSDSCFVGGIPVRRPRGKL